MIFKYFFFSSINDYQVIFFFHQFLDIEYFFQNITSFKHGKHGDEVIFSKYCIIFMGNSWDSLELTYLNQPKPDNLINKYSKGGGEAYFSPKIRLTFFGTKIKQLNHAS